MDYARRIMNNTPIQKLSETKNDNTFYMKREDLLPFSFGGNKARKAEKFKEDILNNKATAVITYGSSESNHCRIISNMCASLNIKCIIVSPEEKYEKTHNSELTKAFGATIIKAPLNQIETTIDAEIERQKNSGENVYFIQGGGHGNIGTAAYVDAYGEIKKYEKENKINFDYIFLASGTGTTQAGLICGQIQHQDFDKKIIGISIARSKNRGLPIVKQSVSDYLESEENFDKYIVFEDKYTANGYNEANQEIKDTIKKILINDGIALNETYTGKAYNGMIKYIEENNITNKKILFINTGGLPLFFDKIEEILK